MPQRRSPLGRNLLPTRAGRWRPAPLLRTPRAAPAPLWAGLAPSPAVATSATSATAASFVVAVANIVADHTSGGRGCCSLAPCSLYLRCPREPPTFRRNGVRDLEDSASPGHGPCAARRGRCARRGRRSDVRYRSARTPLSFINPCSTGETRTAPHSADTRRGTRWASRWPGSQSSSDRGACRARAHTAPRGSWAA